MSARVDACYNCPDIAQRVREERRVVPGPLLEYMAKFKQAGAIVVRAGKTGPRILLVTARRNPDNWIFPKGHVESGETLKVAAVREAREEAGVDGKVVGAAAGKMSFEFGDNSYRVHVLRRQNRRSRKRAGRASAAMAEVQAGPPAADLRRNP